MNLEIDDDVEWYFEERTLDRPDRGCWEWEGSFHGNYGIAYIQNKKVGAHRLSWMLHKGPIPKGLWVLHKCDNTSCIRPSHLFLGDNDDNMADMLLKGRGRYREHLGAETAEQIISFFIEGASISDLAEAFDCSVRAIRDVINRRTYRSRKILGYDPPI